MKNKICTLALVGCLGLTVSGCKGDNNDVVKQVNKMSEVIEEDEIFTEDYAIEGNLTTTGISTSQISYSLKKDGEKYYGEFNTTIGNSNNMIQYWIGKEEEKYYVFYSDETTKQYSEIAVSSIENTIEDLFEEADIDANINLKEIYNNVIKEVEKLIDSCNDNEKVTCSVDKTLFGKVTFNINTKITSTSNSEIMYILKKGKLIKAKTSFSMEENTIGTEVEFDYGNQKVSLPNKDEYTLVE